MKKIDKLFTDFPELNVIKSKIILSMKKKKKSPFFNLYQDYRVRLSKKDKEAIRAVKQRTDTDNFLWGCMYCEMFFAGNFFFWYLNKIISRVKNLQGFGGAVKNLLNIEQFVDTISELEINAFFSRYNPSFDPSIKDSKLRLDSKLKLVERNVFFEVFTPRNTIPCDGVAREIDNKSKGKIKDKIVRQVKECSIKEKKPVVIFINISHASHMRNQIEDSFFGQGQYKLTINNATGDVVATTFQRKENGLKNEEVDSKYLSAIVFYSKKLFWFKVDSFSKEMIINKDAKYKLTPDEIKKIKRFDLRKI